MNCFNPHTQIRHVKNASQLSRMALYRVFCLVSVLVLTACSGDDGADGADAQAASNALPCSSATIPEELFATIDSASVPDDGKVVVEFSVRDGSGYDYACLASNQVRFSIAKLNAPGALGAGESSSWQSYINRTEAAPTNPVNGPGTVAKTQANTEANGTLTNNADGSYRYVFNTNIKAVTTPLAVSYNAANTHRVALQISGGGLPAENASYDWQPSTGSTSGILGRDMVATETCNGCHGELALHGGGRKDVEYCVTCHNPGSSDANSGNTVDFATMIHKIHRGAELPSVEAEGEYAIWGFGNTMHDFSDRHFPQDIRNCRNCHDEDNAATPDAHNWLTYPTAESCGSCHDDVNFVTGANHFAGARTNEECSTCHVGGSGNQAEIDWAHQIGGKADAKGLMAVRIDNTAIDETNGDVQVRFSLINPGDNSVYTQAASAMNFVSSARLYRNPVNPENGYSDNNVSFNISTATPNEAGQYSWDTNVVLGEDDVLAYASRIRLCTDEKDGGLIACVASPLINTYAPATPVWGNIDAVGEQVAANDELPIGADYERCATCHAGPSIAVHGGDYSSLQQCRSCHNNSRLRDIGNLDLKFVIHAYHAGNLDDEDHPGDKLPMHYPNAINQCTACHSTNQLDLPIAANHWAPLTATGVYTSSTAFLCSSCHLTTQPGLVNPADLSNLPSADQAVVNHMLTMGAVFNGVQSAANVTESCAVCHSSGSLAAIDEMHGKLN